MPANLSFIVFLSPVEVLFTDMFVQQVQFYFKGLNVRKCVTGNLSS